jgi:hypothetical protein
MSVVDFVVVPTGGVHAEQRRHFIDHMAPVWLALPMGVRGTFYCPESLVGYAREKGIEPLGVADQESFLEVLSRGKKPLTLVGGHGDPAWLDKTGRKNVILMHGTGFVFNRRVERRHGSYPGTNRNRANTVLMLAASEEIAAIEREGNPTIRVEVIGCPKLDYWHRQPPKPLSPSGPVVALAWHWRCNRVPETNTAFDEYKQALPELARRYKVLGHGHPHFMEELVPIYEEIGIEVVRDLDEVFGRADVMVADGTSAAFEFASLDRPVVICWSRNWHNADYGGMFQRLRDLGVVCRTPGWLPYAVAEAVRDDERWAARRRQVVEQAYTYTDGHCADRAAKAIVEALET